MVERSPIDYGQQLKAERKARMRTSTGKGEWTQAWVAQEVSRLSGESCGQTDVGRWEKGREPNLYFQSALNALFGMDLIEGTNFDRNLIAKNFPRAGSAITEAGYHVAAEDTNKGGDQRETPDDGSSLRALRALEAAARLAKDVITLSDELARLRAKTSKEYERKFTAITSKISRLAARIAAGQAGRLTAPKPARRDATPRDRRRTPRRASGNRT